jgi:hypothetical protein
MSLSIQTIFQPRFLPSIFCIFSEEIKNKFLDIRKTVSFPLKLILSEPLSTWRKWKRSWRKSNLIFSPIVSFLNFLYTSEFLYQIWIFFLHFFSWHFCFNFSSCQWDWNAFFPSTLDSSSGSSFDDHQSKFFEIILSKILTNFHKVIQIHIHSDV